MWEFCAAAWENRFGNISSWGPRNSYVRETFDLCAKLSNTEVFFRDLVTNIISDKRYDVSGAVINSELFSRIKEPFLISVSKILDERYTQQMEIIYTQFIQFIINTA